MNRLIDFTCFVGLKVTSQRLAHSIIFSRSMFKSSAAISGFSTIINKLVSSAKSRIFEPMSVTISLIKSRNRSGPKIDPCGTPARMKFHADSTPGRTTLCLLSDK